MSIHYLLDGYNVIYQMPGLNPDRLEDCRRSFVEFIERHSPQGSANNRVTVVFDGSGDHDGTVSSHVAKVVFSRGETADELIKKIVGQAQNAKEFVVVSDDRDIQYAVRALGARPESVKAFLDRALSARKKSGKPGRARGESPESSKHISKSDEFKIASELKKIWLKSKSGSEDGH